MKSGIFLLQQNPVDEDARTIDDVIDDVVIAERDGMDAILLSEHHFDDNCAYVDPAVFAGVLAARTSRIRIGFAVLQTSLYHPLRLAEQIALLDNVSKGRLLVGLGRGSLFNAHEYDGFGIAEETAQERLEEAEAIMLRCWSGEPVSHRGKYWQFDIPPLRPAPFTRPHPMLLRSAASEGSVRAFASQGRPILMSSTSGGDGSEDSGVVVVRSLRDKVTLFRDTMAEAGYSRDAIAQTLGDSWSIVSVIVAETDRQAREEGLPYVHAMMRYRAGLSARKQNHFANQAVAVVMGSPATVRDRLRDLAGTGLGGLAVRLRIGPMATDFVRRSARLYTSEVLPALAESHAMA